MIDIKRVRSDPDGVIRGLEHRGDDHATERVESLLKSDGRRREALNEVNELKALRNEVSKEIGEAKQAGRDASNEIARMRDVGEQIAGLDQVVKGAEDEIEGILLSTPNLPDPRVPGGGEDANEVLREWGTQPAFDFEPRTHWDLGESLGILDLPRGSKLSGSGFPVLRGKGATLQRGLINWMLDLHGHEHGYTELRVPYLVNRESLTGTGQLPKFADESYLSERDDLWLIPTAEVPVTNLHRDEILPAERLPLAYVAYSPCFRREAGAAGKDTRGLLRVHQFDKVELVRIEKPEDGPDALDELTGHATRILELLGLPYRVVLLASGDLGFSASLTYDLEVWAPGVRAWLEVSSCSTFGDFQSRRAGIRLRRASGDKPDFPHTLNGSALALPRLMVALLETYQQEDGSVLLPEVLEGNVGFREIQPEAP